MLTKIQRLDELNQLGGKRRSMDYQKYFGEMPLKTEDKKKRIKMAEQMEEIFLLLFSYITLQNQLGRKLNKYEMYRIVESRYFDIVEEEKGKDFADKMSDYIEDVSESIVDVTMKHIDEDNPYWISEDRAILIAEEESNTIGNADDFEKASKIYKYKTWETVGDKKVRKTHVEMEGKTIPINDYFIFKTGKGLYPRDILLPEGERAGCRCWLVFS